jgi:hypothetical protein
MPMTEARKPLLDRTTALLAGPFLLGQRALSLLLPDKDALPKAPLEGATRPITVTPPEHAIKRRG